MIACPKCSGKMGVTHTYRTADGHTQRLECAGCGTVGTAVTALVRVDPKYGEGAAVLAKQLLRGPKPRLLLQ